MPIKVPQDLPSAKQLESENIFVMNERRAVTQDIRPLRIAILNLMPNKDVTETQLLRLLGNTPLQLEIVLVHTSTYESRNTQGDYLKAFYQNFESLKRDKRKFDGLVITGAPVERMEFQDVAYWEELKQILAWADSNVFSTMYICWAAQAGLYYHYNIQKTEAEKKIFGIFPHRLPHKNHPLLTGFDDILYAPHSRHTYTRHEDIVKNPDLLVLAESDEAGDYLIASRDMRHIFITGHGEYDADSLHNEYIRDIGKGLQVDLPKNYYPNDDIKRSPSLCWRAHTALLFMNWLNFCVYQQTPFNIDDIGSGKL